MDLHYLAEQDPEQFVQAWQGIRQAARDELRSGDRAARAVEQPDVKPGSAPSFWLSARSCATACSRRRASSVS